VADGAGIAVLPLRPAVESENLSLMPLTLAERGAEVGLASVWLRLGGRSS
jgi:hypothetical protein